MTDTFTLSAATSTQWSEKIQNAFFAELIGLGEALAGKISKYAPVATDQLAGSFTVIGSNLPSGVSVEVGSPYWKTPNGYGAYMEFGTRPHWIGKKGMESLITWVRNKGLAKMSVDITYSKGQVKRIKGQSSPDYRERKIKSIAYAIRAKIAKEGTKERLFVLQAIGELGIPYKVINDGSDMYYELNPVKFLQERGVWNRVLATL